MIFIGTRVASMGQGASESFRQTGQLLHAATDGNPGDVSFALLYPQKVRFYQSDAPVTVTLASGRAHIWPGEPGAGGGTFDPRAAKWCAFTTLAGGPVFLAREMSIPVIGLANDIVVTDLLHHFDGWRQYQQPLPVLLPVSPGCLGSSPMITLVAGSALWGVSSDDSNGTVDGGLGTNRLSLPGDAVFGPDGRLYFTDAGTPFIRYYDPATHQVGTSAISLDRGTGTLYRENSQVFAIGPDGRFYFFLNQLDDPNTPIITSANADNSDGPFFYRQDPITLDLGPISNPYVAPDNSCLYVPIPQDSTYSDLGVSSLDAYIVLRLGIDPGDGSCSAHATYAGYGNNGTIQGIPSNQGANLPNAQGEDVAATDGQVGNCINCYVDPDGNLYTICNQTRMVRKVAAATGHIRSMTNHVPLDAFGSMQGGGYNGDGLPAFTLNDNTPQVGRFGFNSVTVDPCGNLFVNDLQTGTAGSVGRSALARYVDLDGVLHTLAGQVPDLDNTLPTAAPAPARGVTFYGGRWLAWGPDGALYITSTFFDGANVSENAIYRVSSS